MNPPRSPLGQPASLAATPRPALATELLQLCERFFTNASPAVLAELRAFLIAEGVHPATRWAGSPTASASPPTIPGRVPDPCCCAAGRRAAESADAAVADVGGQR